MPPASKPFAIDLFAGAGGFSLAAIQAGMEVKVAVEIDRHGCRTYEDNFKRRQRIPPLLLKQDIRTVDWHAELAEAGVQPRECSLLLGGPPCQGYSAHRINGAGVSDPRNELLLSYFDCLSHIKPHAFLVENVPGLLWPRHADYLSTFMERARRCYRVYDPIVVNAQDYGVPQNRKRVFILGFRSDLPIVPIYWPPPRTHFAPDSIEVLQEGKPVRLTASTVFVTPTKDSDTNAVHMNHGQDLLEVFRLTPKNGGSRRDSGRTLPCHKNHDGHKDVYGRIKPTEPGPTMTTACINPSKGRFVHPTEDHGITARHAARFQTFPDDFTFSGGLIASGRQIGNAVPVDLGAQLIREIRKALECMASAAPLQRRTAAR